MEKTKPSKEWIDLTELEENANVSVCLKNGDTGPRVSKGQPSFSGKRVFQVFSAVESPS